MTHNQALIAELQMEAASTRKLLERVPTEKNEWQPHAKSMSLGRLASHVAELPGWTTMTMNTDELDFAKFDYAPNVNLTKEELLAVHDKNVSEAIATLENAKDEDFHKMWTMRNGEKVYFTLPKAVVLRTWSYNHCYHHRAQLGVYLRLLDIPIPGMYGPSADEMNTVTTDAATVEAAQSN